MIQNKNHLNIFILIVIALTVFFMASCDGNPVPEQKHQVIFDANGGKWNDGSIFTVEIADGEPIWDYRPSVPHRSGYNFKGWYSDKTATKPYDPNSVITEDTILYAGWTKHRVYKVTFEAEGGTAVAPQLVSRGGKVPEPASPEKDGYAFAGWTMDTATGILFDFSTPITSNITLYAIWKEARTITFSFDLPATLNPDAVLSPIPEPIKAIEGETANSPAVTLEYNGTRFRFLGWFESGKETPFDFSQPVENDVKLTAKWEDYAISANGTFITYNESGLIKWASTASSCMLIADITLTEDWTAVSSAASPYSAIFDGNNHTITGLNIAEDTGHQGFFSYIGTNGYMKNLLITSSHIKGSDSSGTIAGENKGRIENCHVSGSVEESGIASGGIAGYNRGTIINCSAIITAKGNGDVGGISGVNYGTIESCQASGTIAGEYAIGGITGLNTNNARIISTVFSGTIADGYYAGGIAGCNDLSSMISSCVFSGTIEDNDWYIGGIAGLNSQESVIENCTSAGNITGKEETGGVVGYNFAASVYGSSFSGNVSSNTIAGGIAGISMGPVEGCYASGTIKCNSTGGGITGINRFHEMTGCYFTGSVQSGEKGGIITGLNEKADIILCCWQGKTKISTIGENLPASQVSIYEISSGYSWDDAMSEMNNALSSSAFTYEKNTGENSAEFPLIIKKKK